MSNAAQDRDVAVVRSCILGEPPHGTLALYEEEALAALGRIEQRLNTTSAAKPYSETLFEVPAVKEALWLLLGGGLDDAGKQKWLAWRLEMGFQAEEIFTQALRQVGGMVAT